VFLEPNKWNPLSALGRLVFPMRTHTPDERPYGPYALGKSLAAMGWIVTSLETKFAYTLGLSYLLKKVGARGLSSMIVSAIARNEEFLGRAFVGLPLGAIILGAAKLHDPRIEKSRCAEED